MKCPYCGSENFTQIVHNNPNTKYILTEIDVDTKAINPMRGIPLDAFGCSDCKAIVLKCPNL